MNSKDNSHQLSGGLGVKVPLGKFDEKGISGVNPSFQLGTGSWDYQMALNYKFQKNKVAILSIPITPLKPKTKKLPFRKPVELCSYRFLSDLRK
jgi:hypothetical protein